MTENLFWIFFNLTKMIYFAEKGWGSDKVSFFQDFEKSLFIKKNALDFNFKVIYFQATPLHSSSKPRIVDALAPLAAVRESPIAPTTSISLGFNL